MTLPWFIKFWSYCNLFLSVTLTGPQEVLTSRFYQIWNKQNHCGGVARLFLILSTSAIPRRSWSCSSLRQTLGKSGDWEKTFRLHHGRCSWIWACCWCRHAKWAAGIADAGKCYYRWGECVWTLGFVLFCFLCFFLLLFLCVCVLVLFCFLNEHLWCNVCCTVFVCEYPGCIIVCWELEKAGCTQTHTQVCVTVYVTCFNLITYRNVRLVQIHVNHRFSEFPQGMWKELHVCVLV